MLNRNACTSLALILALAASPVLAAEAGAEPHQSGNAAMPGCMTPAVEGGMPMMRMMMGQNGMAMTSISKAVSPSSGQN